MRAKIKTLQLERVTILFDHAQIIKLKHAAVDEGRSASNIVRRAVDDFLRLKSARSSDERNTHEQK
jgi:hypothetical protein